MTPSNRYIRTFVSGTLLLGAVLLPVTTTYIYLLPENAPPKNASLSQRLQPNAIGVGEREPSVEQKVVMTFDYPTRLRENETGVVTLRYSRLKQKKHTYAISDPIEWQEIETLDRDVSPVITSSGYKISAAGPTERKTGTKLPTIFKWTITPEKEGTHPIVLDVSSLLLYVMPRSNDQITTEFQINNISTPLREEGIIDLPITVDTRWGVPQVQVSLASGLATVLAFVIAYPVITDWLKFRFRIGNEKPPKDEKRKNKA